jgi:hypothetical protein
MSGSQNASTARDENRSAEYYDPALELLFEKRTLRDRLNDMPSWLFSLLMHLAIMTMLAILYFPSPSPPQELIASPGEIEKIEELREFEDSVLQELDLEVSEEVLSVDSQIQSSEVDFSAFEEEMAAPISLEANDLGLEPAPVTDLLTSTFGSLEGNDLSGRGANKGMLLAQGGGSEGSERAVARALNWIARHQLPNGSWSFDHRGAPDCQGRCGNPGTINRAPNGATAMALLPFLGAGNTHEKGKYKKTVRAGMNYLAGQAQLSPQGASFFDSGGRMYSHGLAAIAICEAQAMTKDRKLDGLAQKSLNYIAYAQDPHGGGWRYRPREPGDTSVYGWQMMALKSGQMGYLEIDPLVVRRAEGFLDNVVGYDGGAGYGYNDNQRRGPGSKATTAIGLLSRMYLGWKRDRPALQRGVAQLGKWGPDEKNMYYNYYATQVMHHFGGSAWERWNKEMRDLLVESQATEGHETGSWYMDGGHSEKGGRLYCTSMATMILEVYYRHLPLFREQSADEDFPLE